MNPASLLLDPHFPADGGASPWRHIKIPAADRTPGDCLRVATAVAYADVIDYRDTPSPPITAFRRRGYVISRDGTAFWNEWNAWPATLGLRWWKSNHVAPVHLPRWIAVVDGYPPELSEQIEGRGIAYDRHAVAMRYDRLLMDPAGVRKEIRPEDVNEALALLPAGCDLPSGTDLWQIEPKEILIPLQSAPKKESRNGNP